MAEAALRPRVRSAWSQAHVVSSPAEHGDGLWHRPDLLNLISDVLILFVACVVGYAAVVWVATRPMFALREVVLMTPAAQVTEAQLEYAARSAIKGNFFTVNLDQVRASFEKLPWVRRAEVRRRWPSGLELRIEEQQAVAYWFDHEGGQMRMVNPWGEVFAAASEQPLPQLRGPVGSAAYLLYQHGQFSRLLEPLGRKLVELSFSDREAWELRLDDGMLIRLGRDQLRQPVESRLARFVRLLPRAQEQLGVQLAEADLRYSGGFALRPVAAALPTPSVKGKK